MGTGTLKPGDRAIDFRLTEAGSGQAISLSDYEGERNVLLIFFRGVW